jgi:hypothetical protein
MASEISTYLAELVLGWIAGEDMPTAPAAVYMALFDGDPTGAGTEVTETIRTAGRVAVTWDAIAGRAMENDAAVDFGTAEAAADVSHVALFDADTDGNMLSSTPLDTPRSVEAAAPVVFPIGEVGLNFN